jgi:surface carbohydrate biosynthesis protein
MIVLTIEIGVREAFGMFALSKKIQSCGHECIVLPRFVLPRIATVLSDAVVLIDGAREVRGRKRLLTRLEKNKNIICLFDTEGFALKEDKLRIRYPNENIKFINYILTWGKSTHARLFDMGMGDKLKQFGNPQFSYFEPHKDCNAYNFKTENILANTAFPAADIVSDSVTLTEARVAEARETRKKFIAYINKKYDKDKVRIRVHPNERADFYTKMGFNISDNTKTSSFEDILVAKEVIGVNCTTLVEARLVGKKATNILVETKRHEDIEAICENIDMNGSLVSGPRQTLESILFTNKAGYDLDFQSNTLIELDHKNKKITFNLRILIKFLSFLLRYVHLSEARKYNYSYIKKVRKILGV